MKQETKHTPGPWETDRIDRNRIMIMRLTKPDHYMTKIAVVEENNTANARLIAAAPELLQALKRLLDHVQRANKDYECTAVAEAAIAKAEGKED